MPLSDTAHGYGLLGIGAYHRYAERTQTALLGGCICDPWWGYCYPGVVPGQAIVASISTTKFGWNAGLGVEFLPIQVGFRF